VKGEVILIAACIPRHRQTSLVKEEAMEFSGIIKTGKEEGREKHVPTITIDKGHKSGRDIVRVVVGHEEVHPNTVEHHIAWIELYGAKKDNDQLIHLGRAAWAPVYSNPNVRFQINELNSFKAFHALAYCNIHGLWGNSLEIQQSSL
jgi:superoxide reductase